jgi:cytochrome c6
MQRFQRMAWGWLILCCFGLTVFSTSVWAQKDAPPLFKAKCSVCHGADGSGNTAIGKALKLRDLRSTDVQKQTDAQLTTITRCGKGKMPAYMGKLSDEQIKHLVEYMRSLARTK